MVIYAYPIFKIFKTLSYCCYNFGFASIAVLALFKLNLGIDLIGGSIIKIEFEERPTNQEIENKLSDLNLEELILQPSGENGLSLKTKKLMKQPIKKLFQESMSCHQQKQ